MSQTPDELARYHRQMLLPGIGADGQRRLRESSALLVGCGALGTVIADALTRAGIGRLVIVDRDVVELTNLQRQVLFEEADVDNATPKAHAAKQKLARINRDVTVEAHVDDFNAGNAERFAGGVDVLLDGLDNFETRYLLNDLAVRDGLPYVYGGAVGTTGMAMTILPHAQHRRGDARSSIRWENSAAMPCLRCVFPDAPPPGTSATCDTAGVLGPVVSMIASHQAGEAIKLLSGNSAHISRSLLSIDVWSNHVRQFDVSSARNEACPCCGRGEFNWLHAGAAGTATSLCGRGAVQINPARGNGRRGQDEMIDFAALAERLRAHGTFDQSPHLMRGTLHAERGSGGSAIELLIFPNGRAIIKGTDEPDRAKSIYARYIGT